MANRSVIRLLSGLLLILCGLALISVGLAADDLNRLVVARLLEGLAAERPGAAELEAAHRIALGGTIEALPYWLQILSLGLGVLTTYVGALLAINYRSRRPLLRRILQREYWSYFQGSPRIDG